jgi:hypothetical protein
VSAKPNDIAEAIVSELQTRRGFDATWDSIDDDVREEILATIAAIIAANVDEFHDKAAP